MRERPSVDVVKYEEELTQLDNLTTLFRESLSRLPDKFKMDNKIGEWGPPQILAHFSGWAQLTLANIKKAQEGDLIPIFESDEECDDLNRASIESRLGMSWDKLFDEFIETEFGLMREYKKLSESGVNDTLLEFGSFCIEEDIGHYEEHLTELESYK